MRRVHLNQHQTATPQQQEAVFRDGRLSLADYAYTQDEFQSFRGAAKVSDVDKDTLRRRNAGVPPKRGSIALNHLLSPTDENILIQQVLSMDRRALSPSSAGVRTIGSFLGS